MTETERKINTIGMYAIAKLAEISEYNEHWTDKSCKDLSIKSFNEIINSVKDTNLFDIETLDHDTATLLRFSKWNDDKDKNGKVLYLIPLWLFRLIPEGTKVESINGSKLIVGKDRLDNDIRFGCVAYGLRI